MKYMIDITLNTGDDDLDLPTQGPWSMDEIQGYIALTCEANPDMTSVVIVLVPERP